MRGYAAAPRSVTTCCGLPPAAGGSAAAPRSTEINPRSGRRRAAGPGRLAQAIAPNRSVIARLQRRDPEIPTDLGWQTVDVTELALRGNGGNRFEAAWTGCLETPEPLTITRPGASDDWRVAVEEWEH